MKFEKYIRKQIEKKIFPGISILVAQGESIRLKNHYGYRTLVPESEPLQPDAIYDLASLTKPLITSLLTAALVERRLITLDTELKSIFPELPFDIKILDLLTHTSGLPAWYPFYLYGQDYRNVFQSVKTESKAGKKVNYSCPGYIMLHLIIEEICRRPFSDLAQEIIIDRLKLENTFFRVPDPQKKRTAPTELGNRFEKKMAEAWQREASDKFPWRTRLILGETHDVNSHQVGGTAGNSGLFSTAKEVFRMALEFFPETASILKPDSIRLFWYNFTPGKRSHRSLGFKLNTSVISSGGRHLSASAIGHSGFTGTSLWLEPRSRSQFILLSNRVHPVVQNTNFNRVRRRIHRLLKKDLGL